jgi:hypothetical protein
VIANPVQETKLLPVLETKVHPDDGGWDVPPSLRGSVDDIVALGGIPSRGQDSRYVGIFVGISLAFRFSEISLGMRLGPHQKVDGIFGLVMGFNTHKRRIKYSN